MSKRKKQDVPQLFDKSSIETIQKQLTSRGETISVAESVTAGLLQLALASTENASQFFQGGLTAYNAGQKTLQLNVEPINALATNCVSEMTTMEMALNICQKFRSHWGVAVTGYATPVPESAGKLFAWYAIASNGKILESSKINGKKNSPLQVQLEFTRYIISRLEQSIKKKDVR